MVLASERWEGVFYKQVQYNATVWAFLNKLRAPQLKKHSEAVLFTQSYSNDFPLEEQHCLFHYSVAKFE